MPWWFWLIPVVATALWWPIGPYYASDDFLAVAYASDADRVLSDFVGPQYSATDVWLFYRPLITASFWLDQVVGGVWPPVGHISNVLAHGASALLAARIFRRFTGDATAAAAACLWAAMPSHVGSIAWLVGRVDSHTTVWCLLAIWLWLRGNETGRDGGSRRWPAVLATTAALMSKELAMVLPPLLTWLSTLATEGRPGDRLRAAVHRTWPLWLLLGGYLSWRLLVLGRFGGYDASNYTRVGETLAGLGHVLLDILVPLRWIGTPPAGLVSADVFLWAAGLPAGIALLLALWRRPRVVGGAAVAFLIALAPMASFLCAAHNPHNLRYYYLPSVALAAMLALAGRWLVLALALAWLWPLLAVRSTQHEADRADAAMHSELLATADRIPPGPMFVAGMPHANALGTAVQLHFAVDRMLRPPFRETPVALYAWRPLLTASGAMRLGGPDGDPFALPLGTTWAFAADGSLRPAPPPPELPELPVAGDDDGVLDLSTARLLPLIDDHAGRCRRGEPSFGLTTPGVHPMVFRLTLFTASGYLSCVCANHALPGEADGRIDIARLFGGDPARPFLGQPHTPAAQLALPTGLDLGSALVVPTTIDVDPAFPVLIEAGRLDLAAMAFVPTHRARRLLRFRFDRSYPAWVRRARGE